MTLRQKIAQEIRERGPIPFSRYMEMCLYDPEFGYYSRNTEQFGKAGDFYTSSDVHAVFGRLLARQFEEIWRTLGSPARIEILELGPGRGLFAQDVLAWSEKKFSAFFEALHYSLAESSPALRQRLQQTLNEYFKAGKASLATALMGRVRTDVASDNAGSAETGKATSGGATAGMGTASAVPLSLPQPAASAAGAGFEPTIVFANELLDAFPVEILSTEGKLLIAEHDGKLTESWTPPSLEELSYLDRHSVHPQPGERIEVPLAVQNYMADLCASIHLGILILIDYGYSRQEQLSGRHRGTLATYRQHSTNANPYQSPGEQDITAHVNFTALSAAAEGNGMQVQSLLTQSQFLMGIGEANQFADAFEDCRLPQERAKVGLQLKHLVTPAGMGESFHVLIASKGVKPDALQNLSGLSFSKSRL